MTVAEFFDYLYEHRATSDLAESLADVYALRNRTAARAGITTPVPGRIAS